jgi:hypothetical protein
VGNLIAVTVGLITTIVLGGLHVDLANLAAPLFGMAANFARPEWLPKVSFTWFAMIGSLVVFAVGVLFSTPQAVLDSARRQAEEAQSGEDKPISLRD